MEMNNMVFQTYSTYYDLFYRDKNYQSEVDYVIQLGNFVPPMSMPINEAVPTVPN